MNDEESLDHILDKLFPLSRAQYQHQYLNCKSITGRHNDPDKYGKCSWCGRKIAPKAMPFMPAKHVLANDIASYRYMYDPDFGSNYWDQY
jgi:hypothetical protein